MGSGDRLKLHMFDTRGGFTVIVDDLTTGTSGRWSPARRTGSRRSSSIPSATTCSLVPHAFHPDVRHLEPEHAADVDGAHLQRRDVRRDRALRVLRQGRREQPDPAVRQGRRLRHQQRRSPGRQLLPAGAGRPSTESSRIQVDRMSRRPRRQRPRLRRRLVRRPRVAGVDHQRDGRQAADSAAGRRSPVPTTGGANFARVAFETDLPRIEDFRPDAPFGGVQSTASGTSPTRPIRTRAGTASTRRRSRVTTRSTSPPHRRNGCTWKEVGGPHIPGIRKTFGGTADRSSAPC